MFALFSSTLLSSELISSTLFVVVSLTLNDGDTGGGSWCGVLFRGGVAAVNDSDSEDNGCEAGRTLSFGSLFEELAIPVVDPFPSVLKKEAPFSRCGGRQFF